MYHSTYANIILAISPTQDVEKAVADSFNAHDDAEQPVNMMVVRKVNIDTEYSSGLKEVVEVMRLAEEKDLCCI